MSEHRSGWGCWLWGCALVVVLLVGGIGACVYLARGTHAELTAETAAYLEEVGRGDLDAAWSRLGPKARAEVDRERFGAFHAALAERLGAAKGTSLRGVQLNRNEEGSVARVDYLGSFERGEALIRFSLEKLPEGWTIQGVAYDPPGAGEASVCPSCGAEVRAQDRFCPQCGAALVERDGQDPRPSEEVPR